MTVTVIIGCSWLPVTGCRAAAGAASLRSAGESTQATSIQVEVVELRPGHWRNSPSLAAVLLEPSRQVGKNPKPRTVLQCQPVTFSPWLGTWASARPEPTRGETRRAWPASEPRAWSRDGRRRGPWPTDIRIEWSADTCLFGLYRGRTGRLGGRSSTPEALYCSTLFARTYAASGSPTSLRPRSISKLETCTMAWQGGDRRRCRWSEYRMIGPGPYPQSQTVPWHGCDGNHYPSHAYFILRSPVCLSDSTLEIDSHFLRILIAKMKCSWEERTSSSYSDKKFSCFVVGMKQARHSEHHPTEFPGTEPNTGNKVLLHHFDFTFDISFSKYRLSQSKTHQAKHRSAIFWPCKSSNDISGNFD